MLAFEKVIHFNFPAYQIDTTKLIVSSKNPMNENGNIKLIKAKYFLHTLVI